MVRVVVGMIVGTTVPPPPTMPFMISSTGDSTPVYPDTVSLETSCSAIDISFHCPTVGHATILERA